MRQEIITCDVCKEKLTETQKFLCSFEIQRTVNKICLGKIEIPHTVIIDLKINEGYKDVCIECRKAIAKQLESQANKYSHTLT